MTTSITTKLPTWNDVQVYCNVDDNTSNDWDEDGWRKLVWCILTYGTTTTTTTDDSTAEEEELKKRTEESRDLIIQVLSSSSDERVRSVLVDGMWLMGCLYEQQRNAATKNLVKMQALCTLIHGVAYNDGGRDMDFLKRLQRTLEPQTLASSGILAGNNATPMMKRKLKINTDLHYRQTKFNLLQEESQGYSKLLGKLISGSTDNLLELVGTFDLDPNRVLDLTLDVLESHFLFFTKKTDTDTTTTQKQSLQNIPATMKDLLQWIKNEYPQHKNVIPHLLGFKYTSDNVNDSLHTTVGLLAQQDMLDMADLQPHFLSTSVETDIIQPLYNQLYKKKKQELMKMGNVSLNKKKEDSDSNNKTTILVEDLESKAAKKFIPLLQMLIKLQCDWDKVILPLVSDNVDFLQKIAFCYPTTIGAPICQYISELLESSYHSPGQDLIITKEEEEETTDKMEQESTDGVIKSLLGPLQTIMSCGSIAKHPVLYCQLCRCLCSHITNTSNSTEICEDNISNDVYIILSKFLVPSLSLFPSNPNLSSELWNVISKLSYPLRYSLYDVAWKRGNLEKGALRGFSITKALPNIESEISTGTKTRYNLKRMSKDNIRDMGRQISKISHNNPMVVFTLILNQIESYDNLILLIVDTFKFVSLLSLDVMGFCLVHSLFLSSNNIKSKVKQDGVNAAQWLASIETFCGAFYKKFPHVEIRGILSFLCQQLSKGDLMELGVLRTLLRMSGGYAHADNTTTFLSQVQLDGRCGSNILQRETSDFGIVEKINIKSSKQLKDNLLLKDNATGINILIQLSQLRKNSLLYQDEKTNGLNKTRPIKILGNLYDNCQRVLDLLIHFLTDPEDVPTSPDTDEDTFSSMSIAKYAQDLPTLRELSEDYGLEHTMSWMLCRPLIRFTLFHDDEKAKQKTLPTYLKRFDPNSQDMKDTYPSMLPTQAWKGFTTELYQTFFSLDVYDIVCPEERYDQEIARLSKEEERLSELQQGGGASIKASLAAAAAAAGGTSREIRDAMTFSKSHEQELERVKRNSTILTSDKNKQKRHVSNTHKMLQTMKDSFWKNNVENNENDETPRSNSHHGEFFTHCVYPRCVVSTEDALFCSKFIKTLHDMGTPGFHTLDYFCTVTDAVVGALYSVTEDEAKNLGLLVKEMWKLLGDWKYDEKSFSANVSGKPGAIYLEGKISKADENENSENNLNQEITFSDFGAVYNRWHDNMGKAFIGCLKSSEYMHTRAALIILTRIVNVYPTRSIIGEKLINALMPLKDENLMQDIKAMAQAYHSQLIKSRDDRVWKDEDDATAKARVEKEKRLLAERRKNAEKQREEMKKDVEQITQQIGGSRTRGWEERNRNNNNSNRGGGSVDGRSTDPVGRRQQQQQQPLQQQPGSNNVNLSATKFTPANGGQTIELRNQNNQGNIIPGRGGGSGRPIDTREYERRGAPSEATRRSRDHTGDNRWERDLGGDQQSSQPIDRRSGVDERERNGRTHSPPNMDGRGRPNVVPLEGRRRLPPPGEKRGRSPERTAHNNKGLENTRGGTDDRESKRMRQQPVMNNGPASGPHAAGRGNSPPTRGRPMHHSQFVPSSQHGDRGSDRGSRRSGRSRR